MNCFLIDDDEDDQDFFAMALDNLPSRISLQTANNGIDALKVLKDGLTPDVIFIDVNMPRMTGWECVKEIRQIPSLKSVPVIMYSTSEYAGGKYPISREYFNEFLTKEPGVSILATRLSEIFNRLQSGHSA